MADEAAAVSKGKVLLIDDDQALVQLYSLELTGRQYVVITAPNGEEGVVKAKAEKPDLVLLDIMMPKLDGIGALTKLKEDAETNPIPVVMLTNFGQENLVQQAFTLGASDYLIKYKVTPAEMADKVAQLVHVTPVQL